MEARVRDLHNRAQQHDPKVGVFSTEIRERKFGSLDDTGRHSLDPQQREEYRAFMYSLGNDGGLTLTPGDFLKEVGPEILSRLKSNSLPCAKHGCARVENNEVRFLTSY